MSKRKNIVPATGDEHDDDKRIRTTPGEGEFLVMGDGDVVYPNILSNEQSEGAEVPAAVSGVGELEGAAAPSAGELEGAAAPSAAAPSAAAPSAAAPSPRLYDDVLCVVFSFLKFRDLTRACVCRAWRYAAATKMESRRLWHVYKDKVQSFSVNLSTCPIVQHHIYGWDWSDYDANDAPTVAEMQLVCRQLPRVNFIKGSLSVRSLHPSIPDLFSQSLIHLDLKIEYAHNEHWCWPVGVQVMETVCLVRTLLHLQLTFENDDDNEDAFVAWPCARFLLPLVQCPELTHFGVEWTYFDSSELGWDNDSLDVLRSDLPHLTRLNLFIQNLDYLLAGPSPCKLVSLHGQLYSREREAYIVPLLLTRLPSLTELRTTEFDFVDPSFMTRLSNLRIVDLVCPDTCPLEPLLSALSACKYVHTLALYHPTLSSAIYRRFLRKKTKQTPPLPNLRHLTVYVGSETKVCSFKFLLMRTRFHKTLRSFEIKIRGATSRVPLSDFAYIRTLRRLEKLTIALDAFSTRMDDATLESFTPGLPGFRSDFFPHMKRKE